MKLLKGLFRLKNISIFRSGKLQCGHAGVGSCVWFDGELLRTLCMKWEVIQDVLKGIFINTTEYAGKINLLGLY